MNSYDHWSWGLLFMRFMYENQDHNAMITISRKNGLCHGDAAEADLHKKLLETSELKNGDLSWNRVLQLPKYGPLSRLMTPSVCSKILFHSIIYLISGTVWKRIYNGFKHSLKLGTATPRAAHHTNYFQLSPCAPPLPLGQSQASRREAQVCHATPVQWNALNKESRNATKAHLLEKRKTPFAWPHP